MWTATQEFVGAEHQEIFDQTKDIPGWQMPGDSYKLYEMAFRAGDVILEIGTYGGRSAVVELRGALANTDRTQRPQFFGLDIDVHGIWRTYNSLNQAGLTDYALLYHGGLDQFVQEFAIQPTMVFVDGDHRYEGVKRDLEILARYLAPGVPVLCHDYLNPENDTGELGVRRAVNEFVEAGYAELIGTFGCSAFLITTNQCQGKSGERMSDQEFAARRIRLYQTYGKQLYDQWQASEADRAARLDAIHQLQHQLNQAGGIANPENAAEIENLKTKLERVKAKMAQAQAELDQTRGEASRLNSRIQAMETSKFWQIRKNWFRLKRLVGLGSNE
jgi:hypothetical protein